MGPISVGIRFKKTRSCVKAATAQSVIEMPGVLGSHVVGLLFPSNRLEVFLG